MEENARLAGLLPAVRAFLREHATHELTYGDVEVRPWTVHDLLDGR